MLKGKKILLGITGSIAAYKSATLVRLLVKAGAEVQVIMTPAAAQFITPLTLSTLSRKPVLTDTANGDNWNNHVMLGRWADVMLVAPLSCNTLAKMSQGNCNNLLLAVYLSATCPVLVAPAMDEDMWHHPTTIQNLNRLKTFGNSIIPVTTGELASGLFGPGRMAEPEALVTFIEEFCATQATLKGKKILITAGPTYEAIDPVRFIGNHSSGKMGVALAQEACARGASVTLVLGPAQHEFNLAGMEVIRVQGAAEMLEAATTRFSDCDIAIMSAAVADYTPIQTATEKIKKNDGNLVIELKKTTDILKTLGQSKQKGQVLVGFALETQNEKANALKKLEEKNADMIVLNSLRETGAGFGHSTNKITIFQRNGIETEFELKGKNEVAKDILDAVSRLLP
jgi:phosphopantothenoylcysteine decarboxylase / phosphopantothenate---cysteine ligase